MAPPSIRYSREELLALRDRPGCRGLPPGLDSDDLSDLQESCFFDKSPTLDGGIYLGPQRGPGGPRAPFGAAARRPAGAGPIHSRLIEEEERGAYQCTNSGQLPSAFGSSPTKPQAIGPRAAPPGLAAAAAGAGRYEDPAKMDRWDSRKLDRGGAAGADDNWQQAKGRDNWRGAGGLRGSMDAGRAAGGGGAGNWGGRGEGGQPAELARSGSSAPKDNGRWVRDDDDWRARKQSGALPEPRYDWSDNRAPAAGGAAGAAGGAAARGPPPGFGGHDRQPEWAEDGGGRPRMTAADIEAERLRMQEQWKKQGNAAKAAADFSMAEIMTDDDIMSMMAEEDEKQGRQPGPAAAANGKPAAAAAPHAGQHVDVAALLGGRPQPGSPAAGIGSPASLAGSDRTESMRSRFANFFKLEETPAPSAAASAAPSAAASAAPSAAAASSAPSAAPAPAAPPSQQQLAFQEQLTRAAAASRASPPPGMPALSPQQPPVVPAPASGAGQQTRDAGQALLAMLKQQQAAQKAAAAGGAPAPPVMPPNAVNAADVTVLEEADKVARLTALQGLDDDLLSSPSKVASARQPPPGALPPGMPHLPPGALPPPGHLAHPQQAQLGGGPPPPHGLPQGFPGQLPPGMLPPHLQHPGHLPPLLPHGAPFPPPGMHHMPPPGQPGGMQPPPGQLGAAQFRPGQPGLQYRPPGMGLPPQPGMQHPGMPPPQLQQQQQQQQQQNALLAQLLAAQARGPPPPAPPPQVQVQPGQQINLAALLGAAGNPGMQLPPMGQQGLNPAQLQALRPPAGMMPPGMPAPGIQPGINPALLQQIHLQQLQLQQQQQRPPPMGPPPGVNPQQLSSAQLMAALGLAQQGGMPQGLR
ncbi:hypothetical protein ABPG75_003410 [Micractinium tetrahymenae]